MDNQLIKIVEESGLEKTQGQIILDSFSDFFKKASEWEVKAKLIKITDISQVKEMADAREARLELKSIRVNADNTRKKLKEKALREGKAIDGIANVIKALIVPIEEYLEGQEKFIENLEIEKKLKLETERTNELSKYVPDITLYNFKDMSDEAFVGLISTVKRSFNLAQEEIKKAELKRIEDEKKEKAEQERIKKENIKLKADAELREKKVAAERAEAKKKLEKETETRKKLEEEAEAKRVAELKEEKEKEEKERQAKLAPEKDKLFTWSEKIKSLEAPTDLSKAGLKIVKEAEEKLLVISQEIKLKIKNL